MDFSLTINEQLASPLLSLVWQELDEGVRHLTAVQGEN